MLKMGWVVLATAGRFRSGGMTELLLRSLRKRLSLYTGSKMSALKLRVHFIWSGRIERENVYGDFLSMEPGEVERGVFIHHPPEL